MVAVSLLGTCDMRTFYLFVVFLMLLMSGCGKGTSTPPPKPTPAVRFDSAHGGITTTPHGRVVKGSARDEPDGRVSYQTDDDSSWVVTPSESPEGEIDFTNLERFIDDSAKAGNAGGANAEMHNRAK